MKQSSLGLGTSTKRTRRREFLDEMDRVVPWSDLVAEIAQLIELRILPAVDEFDCEGVIDHRLMGADGVGEPVTVEGCHSCHCQPGRFVQGRD